MDGSPGSYSKFSEGGTKVDFTEPHIQLEAKKNITALIPYVVFPSKMGGQKGIALFYRYFGRLVNLNLVTPSNSDIPNSYPATFFPILGKGIHRYVNPFLYRKVKKVIKETSSQVLVLEHPYLGWLGILLKKGTGIKLAVHSHNIEALRFRSTGRWWWGLLWHYERLIHRMADHNFFITDEDKEFAVKHFKLPPQRCHTITYGFERSSPPTPEERRKAASQIKREHEIPDNHLVYLFNGTLDYGPNRDALDLILKEINPRLMNQGIAYSIIICGKNLPSSYEKLKAYRTSNVIYAGFVEDIEPYFLGSDVFLNPLTDGGGIKTKLVEALGYNLAAISTKSGAIGVPVSVTGGMLKVVEDKDWNAFAKLLISTKNENNIPEEFFKHFYWGNIAKEAERVIST